MKRSANRRWASVAVAFGCLLGAPAAEAAGAGLGSSSFLGGTDHDAINDVAVDSAGNVYVTGWTQSADFPVRGSLLGWTGGPPDACDYDGCADAFVAKFAPGGRSLIYATYLSGSRHDEGTAIAVDAAGHAYVAGLTNSGDFPAGGNPELAGSGAFVAKLAPDGSELESFRRLGPTGGHGADDIALAGDDLYVVGTNERMDFPTTAGAPTASARTEISRPLRGCVRRQVHDRRPPAGGDPARRQRLERGGHGRRDRRRRPPGDRRPRGTRVVRLPDDARDL